ncbi:unnamed protein product [Caenorhabditis bovis]|uniref:ethanolamine-phosphate cytidylyltransferase n=1 Tax=Caenorhabditis bovis TaxID=2654633 RepID=A0A8S1EKB0_9PELO|nr:unnamed protein product [Caenorhabditis bovis]
MTDLAPDGRKKGSRVWTDGCYDLLHYGHASQLRFAKQFGKKLIVGVYNDEEIELNNGLTVFEEEDRYRMVSAIKWVDEVVEDAPYITSVAILNQLDCDFCVPGDNTTQFDDGKDTYEEVRKSGRYREGKHTNDFVSRILQSTKTHFMKDNDIDELKAKIKELSMDSGVRSPWTRVSRFISSTKQIQELAEGREPRPTDKVVYVCGAFDLFHVGHLEFLEEAKKLGDYLIVGVFGDEEVNKNKGGNYPIMNLRERVLGVLAYKPVDEVLIGAPTVIHADLLNRFKIKIVAEGTVESEYLEKDDLYAESKRRGIYTTVDSESGMTTSCVIERIIECKNLLLRNV